MWHALRLSSRAIPASTDPAGELVLSTSRRLIVTVAAVYLCWHVVATVTWPQALGWRAWILALAVALVTFVPLALLKRQPGAGLLVWLGGLTGLVSLALALFGRPEIASLYVLIPLVAVVTLGAAAGVVAVAAVAALLLAPAGPTLASLEPLVRLGLLAGGAFAGLLGWAAGDSLLTVTRWSLASFAEAQRHMEEARRRRAQLAVALKDLDQAYYRLGRANAVLVAAWKAADEAERFKAEFVANVSHELRTPLNLVIGFSDTMMTSPESYGGVALPGAYRSDLHAIHHSARHLLALVDDVLDLSRIEAGRLSLAREEIQLTDLVAEAIEIVRNYIGAKGLDLRVEVAPDLPSLRLDRLRIRQVMLNLLVNAVRFSERGWIEVRVNREGDVVRVRVSDTGRGIPQDDLPKIFEEFRSIEQPVSDWHSGTGLGLPISRKFVELHGGRMGVESTYGEGATFWFTLPCGPGEPRPTPPRLARPMPARVGAGERAVVVVHEDPQVVPLLQRYLDGFWLLGAADVEQGLALAEEVRAVALVADAGQVGLPPQASVPVVVCPLPSGRRAAAALGAEDLLVKPVAQRQLLEAIDRLGRPARRVLIADDDPDIVRLFQRMLHSRFPGRRCTEAYNGEEALALMRREPPDLVLLDLAMPKVDGRTVLERMAADPALREVPVIIVSAKSQDFINLELSGPLQVWPAGGFGLGEIVRALGALLSVMAPGCPEINPRAPGPEAAPAGSPASAETPPRPAARPGVAG